MTGPVSARRRLRGAAPLLAAVGLLAGCAAASDAPKAVPSLGATVQPPTPSASPTATAPGAVPLGPLTGLPATSPEAADRPVVGVAVETGTGRSAPAGLETADLLYVTFPNPGRQRTIALYQSRDSDRVGPVDDTRPVDNKLMIVTGGVLEHAGGTKGFVSRTDNAELPQFSAVVHPSSFSRDAAGQLFGSTAVARSVPGLKPAVPGLVAFRGPDGPVPAPVPVQVAVPGQPTLGLTYDAATGTWNGSVGPLVVHHANVVVQQVPYDRLDLPHTTATEGDPQVFGAGKAFVLSGRRLIDATWNRVGRNTLTSYVGTDGIPVRLAPGTTVVLLVPTGTPVTF